MIFVVKDKVSPADLSEGKIPIKLERVVNVGGKKVELYTLANLPDDVSSAVATVAATKESAKHMNIF